MKGRFHVSLPLMLACIVGVLLTSRPAAAQYRTTASRVRQLEARLDELFRLNEAFLPTIEQMDARVATLQQRIDQITSARERYAARTEIAELRQRLTELEEQVSHARRSNPAWSSSDDLARDPFQSDRLSTSAEFDDDESDEWEERITRLDQLHHHHRGSQQIHVIPISGKNRHHARGTAFGSYESRSHYGVIEVHVTIGGNEVVHEIYRVGR